MTTAARSVLTACAFLASATPAIALASAGIRGGIGPTLHTDIYVVSALVATLYAVAIWRRLRHPDPNNVPARQWIAGTYHVALTALATGVAAAAYPRVLAAYASDLADTLPFLILWALVQMIGIAVGELAWRTCMRFVNPPESLDTHQPVPSTEQPAGPPSAKTPATATLEWVAPRTHDQHCKCSLDP